MDLSFAATYRRLAIPMPPPTREYMPFTASQPKRSLRCDVQCSNEREESIHALLSNERDDSHANANQRANTLTRARTVNLPRTNALDQVDYDYLLTMSVSDVRPNTIAQRPNTQLRLRRVPQPARRRRCVLRHVCLLLPPSSQKLKRIATGMEGTLKDPVSVSRQV